LAEPPRQGQRRSRHAVGADTQKLGNTGYKTHFRVDGTPLHNYTKTFSVAGYVMALVYHRAKPVKNFLRTYAPNVR